MNNTRNLSSSYLTVDWATKPENVSAFCTLVSGGASTGHYAEFNLATHVGDELADVLANREKLVTDLALPAEPIWLDQIHSNKVILAEEVCRSKLSEDKENAQSIPQADASVSRQKGSVCVVLTADCLPVFFCNAAGTEVAVAHAGWRGLHAGIISRTIKTMRSSIEEILVSLGPAIGVQAFEVGEEVRLAFTKKNKNYRAVFSQIDTSNVEKKAATSADKSTYMCDIYQLARIELQTIGVDPAHIMGGQFCTYSEADRFYSFRRQNQTGRMASLIWLT